MVCHGGSFRLLVLFRRENKRFWVHFVLLLPVLKTFMLYFVSFVSGYTTSKQREKKKTKNIPEFFNFINFNCLDFILITFSIVIFHFLSLVSLKCEYMLHITMHIWEFYLKSSLLYDTETTGLVKETPFSTHLAAAHSTPLGNDIISWSTVFL